MKTTEKGAIGLTAVIAEMTKQGWNVSLPVSEHCTYDLIAEKTGVCNRVQVKYTTPTNGELLTVRLGAVYSNRSGAHTRTFARKSIDLVAAYDPENDACYFVKTHEITSEYNLTLRLVEAKASGPHIVRYARDYIEVPY